MESIERQLSFIVTYKNCRTLIKLYEYDTVEILQIEIHKRFNIPPHKQVINGWRNIPECDNAVLRAHANLNTVTCLEVTYVEKDEEVNGPLSFISKISDKVHFSIIFQNCTINRAISEACLAPLDDKKIILLYLHKDNDNISTIFLRNLKNPQIIEMLRRNFFLLGWDIGELAYQKALQEEFNNCNHLSSFAQVLKFDKSAILCIVSIQNSVTILSCHSGDISDEDFLAALTSAEKFLVNEKQQEKDLENLQKKSGHENDMNSVNYQQLMADMLGDRDYDGFDFDQHDLLKRKVAFALLGQPTTAIGEGYEDMTEVNRIFNIILENNNQISEYRDRVEIAFIYNCIEPLPSVKLERAKHYQNYNPNTDLKPVPIFVLRKCHSNYNPCRIFIDHVGRTYQSWEEYKTRNKLHECQMVLPLNGRYDVDQNGRVLLETHLSPACGIDKKLLQSADYISIVGGLLSGGIFLASAMTSIAIAPAALALGGVTGIGVGIYSIARSAFTLYDRNRHGETLSFADSEARGAYINILAGALGFAGAGANMAITQLASNGVNIGSGAAAVVDTLAVVNISASGVAVLNSGYDVFDKWYNENQTPSWLTVVQLTSSVLFFGNAVYNFRMSSTIVEETQVRTLESYQESLRSNRHRKTFTKLLKETVRQNNFNDGQGRAEVIAAIRNIHNKDDVFAVLTRSNREMNRRGIKISASGGDIVLNGVKINYAEFATMNKKETTSFLSNLPKSNPTTLDTSSTQLAVLDIFKGVTFDITTFTNVAVTLLSFCSSDIKNKVIRALAELLNNLTDSIKEVLDRIFPENSKYVHLMNMVVNFFAKEAERLEEQYKMWIRTKDDRYKNPIFPYVKIDLAKRLTLFFERTVTVCTHGGQLTESALRKLLNYFECWLASKIYDFQVDSERAQNRRAHSVTPSRRIHCIQCRGYYFQHTN